MLQCAELTDHCRLPVAQGTFFLVSRLNILHSKLAHRGWRFGSVRAAFSRAVKGPVVVDGDLERVHDPLGDLIDL